MHLDGYYSPASLWEPYPWSHRWVLSYWEDGHIYQCSRVLRPCTLNHKDLKLFLAESVGFWLTWPKRKMKEWVGCFCSLPHFMASWIANEAPGELQYFTRAYWNQCQFSHPCSGRRQAVSHGSELQQHVALILLITWVLMQPTMLHLILSPFVWQTSDNEGPWMNINLLTQFKEERSQKCYSVLAAFFFPKNHPCFHKVAFNCWLWTRTITGYKKQSCFNKRSQGWLERSISQRNVCCTKASTRWESDHQEMRYVFLFLKWDEMARAASYS